MFFDFNSGSNKRREINLRGNEESQSFEQLERERKNREESKKKERSALTIQSFWRSKIKLIESQKDFRIEFDKFVSLKNLVNVEFKVIGKLLGYFNFFFNKKSQGDLDRLLIILTILFKNNYQPNEEDIHKYCILITGLLKCILFSMNDCLKMDKYRHLVAICIKALIYYTDSNNLQKEINKVQADDLCDKIFSKLIKSYHYHEQLSMLYHNIKSTKMDNQLVFLNSLIILGLRPLQVKTPILNAKLDFTKFFMSIEGILSICNTSTLKILYTNFHYQNQNGLSEDKKINILLNGLELLQSANTIDDNTLLESNMELLQDLENKIFGEDKKNDLMVDSEEEDSISETSSKKNNTTNNNPLKELILSKIKFLTLPKKLKQIFSSTSEKEEKASQKISFFCNLYSLIEGRWNHEEPKMLIALATSTNSIHLLWNHISNSPLLKTFSETLYLDESADSHHFLSSLKLFAKILTYFFKIVDDEELINKQNFLKLDTLTHICTAIKKIVYNIYLSYRKSGRTLDFVFNRKNASLKEVFTQVLTLFHERDSRKKIFDKDYWVCDELDKQSTTFVQFELANLKPEAVELVSKVPFMISFVKRAQIFQSFAKSNQEQLQNQNYRMRGYGIKIKIRRNFIFEDSFTQLSKIESEELKDSIRVEFIDKNGMPEEGIDGGGILKEFAIELSKVIFGKDYGLFNSTEDNCLFPAPHYSLVSGNYEEQFKFAGKMLAKFMYESILIDLPFAYFFLTKLLSKNNKFDDLFSFDKTVYQNLLQIKQMDNIEDLDLNFTIANQSFGQTQIVELKRGGEDISVTKENRLDYIFSIANYRMNFQIKKQCLAFVQGFHEIIPKIWIDMFNQNELQWLISGFGDGFDVEDFKKNVVYGNGYYDTHPTILSFWKVVDEMDNKQKSMLLKFVTSCHRAPLESIFFHSVIMIRRYAFRNP